MKRLVCIANQRWGLRLQGAGRLPPILSSVFQIFQLSGTSFHIIFPYTPTLVCIFPHHWLIQTCDLFLPQESGSGECQAILKKLLDNQQPAWILICHITWQSTPARLHAGRAGLTTHLPHQSCHYPSWPKHLQWSFHTSFGRHHWRWRWLTWPTSLASPTTYSTYPHLDQSIFDEVIIDVWDDWLHPHFSFLLWIWSFWHLLDTCTIWQFQDELWINLWNK